jgi:hypothetical protein
MVITFIAILFVFKCSDDLYPLPQYGILENFNRVYYKATDMWKSNDLFLFTIIMPYND